MPPRERSAREAPRKSGRIAEYSVAPITPSRRRESSAQEARRQEAHHDAIQDAARASARALDDSVIVRTSTCERVVERHARPPRRGRPRAGSSG